MTLKRTLAIAAAIGAGPLIILLALAVMTAGQYGCSKGQARSAYGPQLTDEEYTQYTRVRREIEEIQRQMQKAQETGRQWLRQACGARGILNAAECQFDPNTGAIGRIPPRTPPK
jgi:hypothetical protein